MTGALAKGARITGPQRTELGDELARRYRGGESIRALAEDTGRSFGFVHGLIKESGVNLRGRGGATRGPAAANARTTVTTETGTAAEPDVEPASPAPSKSSKKKDGASHKDGAKKDGAKKQGTKKDGGKKDGAKKGRKR